MPPRDGLLRAGGFRISDGFIGPLDLVDLGLLAAEEAQQLHELESKTAAPALTRITSNVDPEEQTSSVAVE